MRNYDAPPQAVLPESSIELTPDKIEQRRREREVHQRLEELNKRRLRRLLSDEWDN